MIAIIDYNAGNITSVKNAIDQLGYPCTITSDKNTLLTAEKVIFPGVGEASSAMSFLRKKNLDKLIQSLQQPVLGICLGQQLMCQYSEEGETECLGIFDVEVKKFPKEGIVPHTGWNSLYNNRTQLLDNIENHSDVYFVHSYYCEVSQDTIAECDYLLKFSAAMHKNNFFATQFHPEKSGKIGLRILSNFLSLKQ